MSTKQKLTKTACDNATYQGGAETLERFVIWDTELIGLGLRVTPNGKKSLALYGFWGLFNQNIQ